MPMHIGLLMTYNEVDVIEETLAANRDAVDTIFALDGSDDGTTEVLASDPQVELLLRDEDVAPAGRVRLRASVQERVRWYSPFWVEVRQFKSGPHTRYRERHGVVVPDGVGWRPFSRMPILKHYPCRSPEQTRARLRAIRARGFSGCRAGHPLRAGSVEDLVYRPRYGDAYRRALRFDGDFGTSELARQGTRSR